MENKKNRVLLIDGLNVVIAMNAVTFISDHNGNPIGMMLGVLNQLRTFVDRFKPQKIIFALDGPEAGERRRILFPEYKNRRRVQARESKVQIMDGEDNIVYGSEGEFQNQLIKIYEFLKLLPVTVTIVPCCEADDIISYLALKNKEESECIIISNDKDYLQLIQEGIMVYRWKTKKLYDVKAFEEEYKILPANYIFQKIFSGDKSDLIKGVKGMGKKTLEKVKPLLLNNVCTDMSHFYELLEGMNYDDCNTREKNSIQNSLLDKDKMDLSFKLMKLSEDCMLPDHRKLLQAQIEEQEHKSFSRLSFKLKMSKNNFNKLYNGFNDEKWMQPFAFLKPDVKIIS